MVQRKTAPQKPGQSAGSGDISLTIPVAPEMEIVATAQVAALGEHIGMSRDKIDEVKLALVEACINAFEHAQTRDERLHLIFRTGREEDGAGWLEVEVLDQGKGFDHLRIEPPTPEQTFEGKRKRGWGLQIIRSLMDGVQITSGEWGTRILMRKYK
jgi:serine/threonine-protein kinase RsbW